MNVKQFEAQSDGSVLLKATWKVRGREEGGETLHLASSVISITVSGPASGRDYDELVAAYSEAVAGLSREVAAAVSDIIRRMICRPCSSTKPSGFCVP